MNPEKQQFPTPIEATTGSSVEKGEIPLNTIELMRAADAIAKLAEAESSALMKEREGEDLAYMKQGLEEYNSGKSGGVLRSSIDSFADHPDTDVARWAREKIPAREESLARHRELALTSGAAHEVQIAASDTHFPEAVVNTLRSKLAIAENEKRHSGIEDTFTTEKLTRAIAMAEELLNNPAAARELSADEEQLAA